MSQFIPWHTALSWYRLPRLSCSSPPSTPTGTPTNHIKRTTGIQQPPSVVPVVGRLIGINPWSHSLCVLVLTVVGLGQSIRPLCEKCVCGSWSAKTPALSYYPLIFGTGYRDWGGENSAKPNHSIPSHNIMVNYKVDIGTQKQQWQWSRRRNGKTFVFLLYLFPTFIFIPVENYRRMNF